MKHFIEKAAFSAVIITSLLFVDSAFSQYGLREKDIQFSESWLDKVRSGIPDQELLIAAMVSQLHDEALASELLARALNSTVHEPMLISTAIQSCFSNSPSTFCEGDSLYEELIQIDQDNLEPYLYFMIKLLESGRAERALQVLNDGLEAGNHDMYFYRKINMLTEKLLLLGYPAEEVIYPAQVYANSSIHYSIFLKVLSGCTEQSVLNNEWKLSCLFLGVRLQHSSKGLMAKVFGGAIQRDVLKAVDADQDVLALVLEHNAWVNKTRDLANEKIEWMSPEATGINYPDYFVRESKALPEFEAILRAIFRTQ